MTPAFRKLVFFYDFGAASITTTHLHAKVITMSDTPASTLDAVDWLLLDSGEWLAGCLLGSGLSWRESWKKRGQIQKSSENHWKIKQNGPQCLILLDFPKVFTTFLDLACFFFFQDFLQLRPEPSRQPATGRGLAWVGHPASWLFETPAILHQWQLSAWLRPLLVVDRT